MDGGLKCVQFEIEPDGEGDERHSPIESVHGNHRGQLEAGDGGLQSGVDQSCKDVNADGFDFEKLAQTVRTAVKFLDRVIDINFYPIGQAADSNKRWRPVGLGVWDYKMCFSCCGCRLMHRKRENSRGGFRKRFIFTR